MSRRHLDPTAEHSICKPGIVAIELGCSSQSKNMKEQSGYMSIFYSAEGLISVKEGRHENKID